MTESSTTVPEVPHAEPAAPRSKDAQRSKDEEQLAALGYTQELSRTWSSFSNFAISFSIISILAGCFTTFAQAWNNGGPIAISLGWPVISAFILVIGLCMAELASAYPTSGGIYWWASKLGGAKAGYYTGWLNLIGLLAVTASVAYGAATFLNIVIDLFADGYATGFLGGDLLLQQFFWFAVIMLVATLVNVYSGHLLAAINNVSVWWHVVGALAVVVILVVAPSEHQSFSFVFTERINNSGFGEHWFWFYVLPLGFLLTQYTITGFDASAHMSEETKGASKAAAQGIWRSILYSAVGGWVLLLSFLFAATRTDVINSADPEVNPYGIGSAVAIFATAVSPHLLQVIMIITTAGQLFCCAACLTSCSRMMFAFSRDGAVPGGRALAKVNRHRVPVNAVVASAVVGVVITLPALYKSPTGAPTAFYAVVSIAVIGLYLAFLIPIWLRLRAGSRFTPGEWTLGGRYRWMCWVAVVEIVVISVYFVLPFSPSGVPFDPDFTWTAVNYAPILTGGALLVLWAAWHLSAKKWYTGPVTTAAVVEHPPAS